VSTVAPILGGGSNTAARLEEHAKRASLELVISQALLERVRLPSDVTASHCGDLALRGKESSVIAYSLSAQSQDDEMATAGS